MNAGTPDDGRKRRPIRWVAHHHNGWTTIIAEQADRTFAASVTNGDMNGALFLSTPTVT
jgi:hypothetical protein